MELLGGIRRRLEEENLEGRRKEEFPGDQYKGQRSISNLIVRLLPTVHWGIVSVSTQIF